MTTKTYTPTTKKNYTWMLIHDPDLGGTPTVLSTGLDPAASTGQRPIEAESPHDALVAFAELMATSNFTPTRVEYVARPSKHVGAALRAWGRFTDTDDPSGL